MDPNRIEPSTPLAPVGETERIASLDVLRGLALLGIFVMNIPTFAFSQYAYYTPWLQGGFEGVDYAAWLVSHLLFEQKMMPLFSMLFGAGIVLFTERSEARSRGRAARGVHYRRMAWLLAIGMLHAYLIWYGDILVAYALVGMLVYPLRRLSPRVLLILGTVFLLVSPLVSILMQIYLEGFREIAMLPDAEEGLRAEWRAIESAFYPSEEMMDAEREIALSGFLDRAAGAAPGVVWMQTVVFATWMLWRTASMMLLGMALYKWGVFSAARSTRFYTKMVVLGLALGLPIILLGVRAMHASDFDPIEMLGFNGAFNYFGSVGVALAWVGALMLLCKAGAARWLQQALSAVGRMAFTNYLMQSLIAAFIFYGWGLGYYGSLSRSELLLIVVGVWAFQLVASTLWLRHFHHGPMEWLWRSLTYWRPQPLRRISPAAGTDQ